MAYGLKIAVEPSEEPITTAEAKLHLGIASAVTGHDTYIDNLITAARKYAEDYTNRSFVTTEWQLVFDQIPYSERCIKLPRSPTQSVESIEYVDSNGVTQTWSDTDYIVSTAREPGMVALGYEKNWPSARLQADAITISYTAGYGDAADVPQVIKQAILLIVGHWFANREAVAVGNYNEVPMAASCLLNTYRVGDEFVCYAE